MGNININTLTAEIAEKTCHLISGSVNAKYLSNVEISSNDR